MRPDWVDDDVGRNAPLRDAQVSRLLDMNKLLQDTETLEQVLLIKRHIESGDEAAALALIEDFSFDEQGFLLIAPTYGGVFTTEERKLLMRK